METMNLYSHAADDDVKLRLIKSFFRYLVFSDSDFLFIHCNSIELLIPPLRGLLWRWLANENVIFDANSRAI